MNRRDFFERTLPNTGTKYMMSVGLNKPVWFDSLDDLEVGASYHVTNSSSSDLYYGTAAFDAKERKQKNVEAKKSLYIDLDVGPEPEKYSNQKEALQAAQLFPLSPSLIVSSGRGIHLYWTFDTDVPKQRWDLLATKLKEHAAEVGVTQDGAVTSDSARYLRMPGSVNHKNGATVQVLPYDKGDYTLQQIESWLGAPKPALGVLHAVTADDLSDGAANPSQKYYAKHMVQYCNMFAKTLQIEGKGLREDLWHNQLQVLSFCEDGDEYAHKISKGHDTYSYAETEEKFQYKLANKNAPTKCSTFAKKTKACEGCPYYTDTGSPLHTGTGQDPSIPKGWGQDELGIFRWRVDDNGVATKYYVTKQFILRDLEYVFGDPVELWATKVNTSTNERTTVSFELGRVPDKTHFFASCASKGITFRDIKDSQLFGEFILSWTIEIQGNRKAVVDNRLGWDQGSFVAGRRKYTTDHNGALRVETCRLRERYQQINQLYEPTGKADPWHTATSILCRQKRWSAVAAILSSFAAPLTAIAGTRCSVMAFTSRGSGTGKTATLKLASSIWGHPVQSMMQLNDTENAVLDRVSYLNSLPIIWDEIRHKEPEKFMEMVFNLTQGREKARLDRAANAKATRTWHTMMLVASNRSIADYAIATASDRSEAGRVRVFEIAIPELGADFDTTLEQAEAGLEDNYGVVGEKYLEYIVENRDTIKTLMTGFADQWRKSVKASANERMWVAACTAVVTAAIIVNKLGLMKFDTKEFITELKGWYKQQQDDLLQAFGKPTELGTDFISEYIAHVRGNMYIVNRMPKPGPGGPVKFLETPSRPDNPVKAVLSIDTGQTSTLRVPRAEFDNWCRTTKQAAPRDVLKGLKAPVRYVALDLAAKANSRVRCYDITIPKQGSTTAQS